MAGNLLLIALAALVVLPALAAAFHKFYAACRIKGEEKPVLLARLKLADTTRAVLKNAMTLIGCSAPEKM
jgi:arginyl-tRNA synthetase